MRIRHESRTGIYCDEAVQVSAPREPRGVLTNVLPKEHRPFSEWSKDHRLCFYRCTCGGWVFELTYEAIAMMGASLWPMPADIRRSFDEHLAAATHFESIATTAA